MGFGKRKRRRDSGAATAVETPSVHDDFHLPGITDNPDDPRALERTLPTEAHELWQRLVERVALGNFELPRLPRNSMTLVRLATDVETDVREIVDRLKQDPPLASALLAAANSVHSAGKVPIDTLDGAVVRIGLNGLRSLVLTLSIKSSLFSGRNLPHYAEQVWRQSYSCGQIAREIHKALEEEPESGFMLGLIHDIGKISLLATIHEELDPKEQISRTLVAQLFHQYHEQAGRLLAEDWNLPPDLVSVIGNHHRWEANETHRQAAAVCSLAHRLDLTLSMAWIEKYRSFVTEDDEAPEFAALGIDQQTRSCLLARCVQSFKTAHGAVH